MSLTDITTILGKKLQKFGIATSITAAMVCEAFDAYVQEQFGAELAQEVGAVKYVNHVLTIKVSSSVLAQEVKLREDDIKDAINKKLDKKVVTRLAFTPSA